MGENESTILPYRVTGDDLISFVEARARGRDLSQIRTLFPAKSFDGLLIAAQSFGLLTTDTDELSPEGKELALASEPKRRQLLLAGMLNFEPYDLLLDAILHRANGQSPLEWIQTWWATHGYGNSATNRSEGATTFARCMDYSGLATYIQGRRGHVSRVEWNPDCSSRVNSIRRVDGTTASEAPERGGTEAVETSRSAPTSVIPAKKPSPQPGEEAGERLHIPLGSGRRVEVLLPPQFTSAERDLFRRILDPWLEHFVESTGLRAYQHDEMVDKD